MCMGGGPKIPSGPSAADLQKKAEAEAKEKRDELNAKKRKGRQSTLNKESGAIGVTSKALGDKSNTLF